MKNTYHDRLCAGLEARGWKRDQTDKSRYDAYFHPASVQRVKYFVGPNGALRQGECASRSHSVGDAPEPHTRIYQAFLDAGDEHLRHLSPPCLSEADRLRAEIAELQSQLACLRETKETLMAIAENPLSPLLTIQ